MEGRNVFTFNLSPGKVFRRLLYGDIALTLISVLATLFIYHHDIRLNQALLILSTNEEASISTWYASFKLLVCAGFVYLIYRQKRAGRDRFTRHWKVLCGILLYISIDEIATFRESIAEVLYPVIRGSGVFRHNWVILVLPIVVLTAVFYIRFLVNLPKRTRRLFTASGVMFVVGAMGFEMATAQLKTLYPRDQWQMEQRLIHLAFTHTEELLEMVAISLLLYAVLYYIRNYQVLDACHMGLSKRVTPMTVQKRP